MNAQILYATVDNANNYQIVVLCPFCNEKHKHGLEGTAVYGTVRAADCGRGEYKVILKSKPE
jgi:hypothetical protein